MPGTYKERITSIPSIPIYGKSEDSAPSHKARTEILTSLCQNVLTLDVKKIILVLALNASTNTPPHTHTPTDQYLNVDSQHPLIKPKTLCYQHINIQEKSGGKTHTHPHTPIVSKEEERNGEEEIIKTALKQYPKWTLDTFD